MLTNRLLVYIKLVSGITGAVAQLGERLNGIQEVGSSILPSSTRNFKGLRHKA